MDYSLDCRDEVVIIAVRGRVDESSWEAFGGGLSEAIVTASEGKLVRVVVDLAELEYMSSRGLRALTVAKREAEQADVMISLAAPNDIMREILSISRYDKLFTISDTVQSER